MAYKSPVTWVTQSLIRTCPMAGGAFMNESTSRSSSRRKSMTGKRRPTLKLRKTDENVAINKAGTYITGPVRARHNPIDQEDVIVVVNSRGQKAEQIPAAKLRNKIGEAMRKALTSGAVTITKHNEAHAVLLSIEEYSTLVAKVPSPLRDLTEEFDSLVRQMQSTKSKKAVRSIFSASPADFGKAAAAAAKQNG